MTEWISTCRVCRAEFPTVMHWADWICPTCALAQTVKTCFTAAAQRASSVADGDYLVLAAEEPVDE